MRKLLSKRGKILKIIQNNSNVKKISKLYHKILLIDNLLTKSSSAQNNVQDTVISRADRGVT